MSKEFVIGDIHGAHIPLKQCLERSGFDKENDLLITLGDICDGWPYVYECIEELLTIKNRIDIVGNHDEWFNRFLDNGIHPDNWRQGGRGTAISYLRGKDQEMYKKGDGGYIMPLTPDDIPATHWKFFKQQNLYYKDNKKRVFVHGGFNHHENLKAQKAYNKEAFYWDRNLIEDAIYAKNNDIKLKFKEKVSEVYIGHTQTNYLMSHIENGIIRNISELHSPIFADIVINLDTGAGSSGVLTIMDINTKQYWQSDPVNKIYGPYKPRG